MVDYWSEEYRVNNGKNGVKTQHFAAGSIADSANVLLISGLDIMKFDAYSVALHNTHPTASFNVQVYGNNASGADTGLGFNGSTYGVIGDPLTVAPGASVIGAWETTKTKFLLVNGSASAATSGGLAIDLLLKSRA